MALSAIPPPTAFLHPRQTAFAGFWCSPRRSTQSPCSPYRCEASGLYTPVRLHLHMQDPQCRGYSSPAVDTHPCSHSSHHSHPLAQRRICQCCHPAHPVRKQHRGPVRSVLCRMIRCNFPYSDRRQDERRNIPYRVRHAKYSLEGSQIAYHDYWL